MVKQKICCLNSYSIDNHNPECIHFLQNLVKKLKIRNYSLVIFRYLHHNRIATIEANSWQYCPKLQQL